MDWRAHREHEQREQLRRRARTGGKLGEAGIGLARSGAYGLAAANARECARLVGPLSPTLGALWAQAADTWQARALPPLRLFEDE